MSEGKEGAGTVWKVATGIVLGVITLSVIDGCTEALYMRHAMQELERISKDPDPMGLRANIASTRAERERRERQQAEAQRQAEQEALEQQRRRGELRPGEACLNGELYSPRNHMLVPTGERC